MLLIFTDTMGVFAVIGGVLFRALDASIGGDAVKTCKMSDGEFKEYFRAYLTVARIGLDGKPTAA